MSNIAVQEILRAIRVVRRQYHVYYDRADLRAIIVLQEVLVGIRSKREHTEVK